MINLGSGAIHLSYEQGSGGTSLCLTIARKILKNKKKVIWLSKELPDGKRSSQILSGLTERELENISFIFIKNNLEESVKRINVLFEMMTLKDLIVIDDWCDKSGRASKIDIIALEKIVTNFNNTNIIVSSTSYQNIDSSTDKWESRGGNRIREIMTTIFLYRETEMNIKRILKEGEELKIIKLLESGFE
ncbi:MAG: hypothetical protein CMA13_02075 [Euryarchaeota archaeon]|nr:hypothetical protein [Euryarchaeota archaeon]OUV26148.1 MAG: hypothetical protein CBC57_03470 [Euryarchaeota archaeon TMED97]|tara:strand:+ start:4024 stop:4593 length:570 start_codon:yes stop_codon:yes gene_type:complete